MAFTQRNIQINLFLIVMFVISKSKRMMNNLLNNVGTFKGAFLIAEDDGGKPGFLSDVHVVDCIGNNGERYLDLVGFKI